MLAKGRLMSLDANGNSVTIPRISNYPWKESADRLLMIPMTLMLL